MLRPGLAAWQNGFVRFRAKWAMEGIRIMGSHIGPGRELGALSPLRQSLSAATAGHTVLELGTWNIAQGSGCAPIPSDPTNVQSSVFNPNYG
jgi:hypothetical protein